MSRKGKPSPGASPARAYRAFADGRDQQGHGKYNTSQQNRKPLDVDAHLKAIRRAINDAYFMFWDWPYQYSYFVNQSGKLQRRIIGRAEA